MSPGSALVLSSLLTLGAVSALGCAPSAPAPSHHAEDAATDVAIVTCTTDPAAQTYVPGMEQAGAAGVLRVRLVKADPGPPALGGNTWTIAIVGSKGEPVTDATFPPRPEWGAWENGVRPFMPRHGHPSSVAPTIAKNPDGTYAISDLQLFMPGLWQVTFNVVSGAGADTFVFGFCVAG